MEKHLDKKLEKLADRMMQESTLEMPSSSFTDAVMGKIEMASKNQITAYKPLISKTGWTLISVSFLVIIYLITTITSTSSNFFDVINFDVLFNNQITRSLSSLNLSKTVMYSIILFGLMLCVQIPILKNYFDKRLSL